MTSKAIVALAFLLAAAGTAQAQVVITDQAIIRKTGRLHLDIHYPVTGVAGLDRLLDRRSWAKADRRELEGATPRKPYSTSVGYTIKRNDARMLSVQFESYVYTGGAHGRPDVQSFNFLMPEGRDAGLSDFVDGRRGLEQVRDLVVADLNRQMPDLQEPVHLQAKEDWFGNFAWKANELEVTFAPYEVAGYAQGTLVVHIPMAKLKGVIRPDPHRPAASFDCALAKSRIEKAVCSDAELAQLDRKVAEKYDFALSMHTLLPEKPNETPSQKLSREVAQGYHDKAVSWQRDWLAQRDKACARASVACLKASYSAHLKAPRP